MNRKQLHVFIPVEGTEEQDNRDSESIDEGFMDETDSKLSIQKKEGLKIQTGGRYSAVTSLGANSEHISD